MGSRGTRGSHVGYPTVSSSGSDAETEVILEPHTDKPVGRPSRHRRVAGVAAVVLILCGAIAVFTRGRDAGPPRFVPTYVPGAFSSDPSVWSFASAPGDRRATEYGHVGPDGRLDHWLQLRTAASFQEPIGEPDMTRDGRQLWFEGHPIGELRGFVDIDGCGMVWFWGTVGGDALVDALFAATCSDGFPTITPFEDMRVLCRENDEDQMWALSAPATNQPGYDFLRMEAFHNDCPVETSTGLVTGVERFKRIGGRRVAIWTNDGRAGATFRADDHTIVLTMYIDPDRGYDIDVEITRVLEGLRRVSTAEWRALEHG
jgi:hypothetical protein